MSAYRTRADIPTDPPAVTQVRLPKDAAKPESLWIWVAVALLAAEVTIGYWADFSPKWLAGLASLDVILFSLMRIGHLVTMRDERLLRDKLDRGAAARTLILMFDRWPDKDSRKDGAEWILAANRRTVTPPMAESIHDRICQWSRE